MGGGGPVTNTKQYRKRVRQYQAESARLATQEAARIATLPPDHFERNRKPLKPGQWVHDDEPELPSGDVEQKNGWDFQPPVSKSDEELLKERVESNLAGWPWNGVPGKLVTLSPFCINRYPKENVLKMKMVEQDQSPIVRFLRNELIRQNIGDIIFRQHATAWKFAATCQEATNILGSIVDLWDMSLPWFNNCERPTSASTTPSKSGLYSPPQTGSVASVVIVTPIRGPGGTPTYAEQLDNLNTMCISISNFADYFRNIQFHRVPFLTMDLLTLLIPSMRNLKVLGVYKCQLIHLVDGLKLLDIIKADRPLGKETQVHLDFYPNYHFGPVIISGDARTVGSFGVTWDDWKGPTDIATWAVATKLIAQAKLQGVDMYSSGTMFKKFLDDSPCYDVDNTLAAIALAFGFDHLYPGHSGFLDDHPQRVHHLDGTAIQPDDFVNLYPLLAKAVALIDQRNPLHKGDVEKMAEPNERFRPEGYRWTMQPFPCVGCRHNVLGIFFSYPYIQTYLHDLKSQAPALPIHCLGCRLSEYLSNEKDHFKGYKRNIIRSWLSKPINSALSPPPLHNEDEINDNDLSLALQDFQGKRVRYQGEKLDRRRDTFITRHQWDPETEEKQVPVSIQAMKANRGNFLGAPKVGDWKAIVERKKREAKDPMEAQWNWFREDRYAGHHKYQ